MGGRSTSGRRTTSMIALAVALAVALALVVAGCKKEQPKPVLDRNAKVGDACSRTGQALCKDGRSSIVCVDGKFERQPCRQGCFSGPGGDTCRNARHLVGEYCHQWDSDWHNHECSVDGKLKVACRNGRWSREKPCRGRLGCRWIHRTRFKSGNDYIACDDVVIEPGAPCSRDGRHTCTTDDKATLVCNAGKWADDQFCRGPMGCRKTGDTIACDDTVAEVDDPCVEDGDLSCSVDRKTRLVCKAGKMVKDKACTKGCRVSSDKVRGSNPRARVECN